MSITAVIMRPAKRRRALRVQHVRCSDTDTELQSSNTQGPKQILLFEIHQALDYFASKLSFIISTEPAHSGSHFVPPHSVTKKKGL